MNFMSKFLFAIIALVLGTSSASAIDEYDWSYVSSDLAANGFFTTGAADGSGFDITSITGTSNGNVIAGLLGFGVCCGIPANNNIFYPSGTTYFDDAGLGYSDSLGNQVNIFGGLASGGVIQYRDYINNSTNTAGSLTISAISAVPEPKTYAMLLAGLGLIGFKTLRRKQHLSV